MEGVCGVDDLEFEARLRAFDERHAQFVDRLDALDQQFYDRSEESDRQFQESQRRFNQRLDDFDQRDTALLQRLERLREQVDVLTGQSGQVADDLVEHKRDRGAHG